MPLIKDICLNVSALTSKLERENKKRGEKEGVVYLFVNYHWSRDIGVDSAKTLRLRVTCPMSFCLESVFNCNFKT